MYVDARVIGDVVWVSERTIAGERRVYRDRAPYTFYFEDENGTFDGLNGERLKRVRCHSKREFDNEIKDHKERGHRLFESDVPLSFRYLEQKYQTDDLPPLRISFFDIEVDKDPERDYSTTSNPFNPITAITVYNKWNQRAITVAVPPPGMTYEDASLLLAKEDHNDGYGALGEDKGYFLARSEAELLEMFLLLIEDADVISGWNSEFYDLPYLIQRTRIVLGNEALAKIIGENKFEPTPASEHYLKKYNLFPCLPKKGQKENYKKLEPVFELYGRKHLDYKPLFQKFYNKGTLHSYSLDYVLETVIGQNKIHFDGDIGSFYRREFRKFLAYNRQDVMGLSALDDACKMIMQANQAAHMAGVTLDKVLGSVSIIEQAILKILHNDFKKIAPDKPPKNPDKHVPGAFVVEPRADLYNYGCSFDINSLYPSIIIMANISPEAMIGQINLQRTMDALNNYVDDFLKIPAEARKANFSHRNTKSSDAIDEAFKKGWQQFTGVLEYHDIMERNEQAVTIDLVSNESFTKTAREMSDILQRNGWSITANGTVFDMNKTGIVPYCLSKWFDERVVSKDKAGELFKLVMELEKAGDVEKAKETKTLAEYYDMVQQAKKLFLNSTYGAFLNAYFRFYDSRCGRSVTLSGRIITKHMIRKSSELLTGSYDFDRRAIIYGDTDSCYVSLQWYIDQYKIDSNDVDAIVALADRIGSDLNASFPPFVSANFYVDLAHGARIKAKRETVFRRGLFKNVKKRYVIYAVDTEGKRKEEIKVVGVEIKRTDTPKYVQNFLKDCVTEIVQNGKGKEDIMAKVEEFRQQFRKMPSWKKGSPRTLSNLEMSARVAQDYQISIDAGEQVPKPNIYYVVQAAMNTNMLIKANGESRWDYLRDGDKVSILDLRSNPYNMKSVAVRVDEVYAPEWFQRLPFNDEGHEEKLVTDKLENLFDGLGWTFRPADDYSDEFFD